MKTWWQVYFYKDEAVHVFGFASVDNKIVDHPEYKWKGFPLAYYKPVLLNIKAEVVKICEQQITKNERGHKSNTEIKEQAPELALPEG